MTIELIIEFAVIAMALLLAGVVHSIIGFGYGIVALAILPNFIDVRMAHVILSLSSVPVLLMAAWAYRKGIDRKSLLPALIGAALFMPIGLLAFKWMSMDLLVRGTGLAILLTTLNSLRQKPETTYDEFTAQKRGASVAPFAAGALSGFLGGAVSIAGPPIATYAVGQAWSADRFKSFVTQCLLVICFYKVAGLAVADLISRPDVVRVLWASPFSIAGIWMGVRLSRMINPEHFQKLVAVALILVACLFLLRGAPNA